MGKAYKERKRRYREMKKQCQTKMPDVFTPRAWATTPDARRYTVQRQGKRRDFALYRKGEVVLILGGERESAFLQSLAERRRQSLMQSLDRPIKMKPIGNGWLYLIPRNVAPNIKRHMTTYDLLVAYPDALPSLAGFSNLSHDKDAVALAVRRRINYDAWKAAEQRANAAKLVAVQAEQAKAMLQKMPA